jgi:hypothetical protein
MAFEARGMYMKAVRSPPRSPGPDLAKTSPSKAGPFGALLAATVQDPAAARGLALAYASLTTPQRWEIVDAIVADAAAEGICVASVLAPLLAVEEVTDVAQHIAAAISRLGGQRLDTGAQTRALVAGDEFDGGVLMIRPLHGTFTEVLALAWKEGFGVTHAEFEPLLHDTSAASTLRARLPGHLNFESAPVRFAIDLVTPVLWQHRRSHGSLPLEMHRFADLFSIDLVPERDRDSL